MQTEGSGERDSGRGRALRVALNVWNVEAFGLQCVLTEGGREGGRKEERKKEDRGRR